MAKATKSAAARNRRILEASRDGKAIEAAVVRAVARAVRAARPKRKSTQRQVRAFQGNVITATNATQPRVRTTAEMLRDGKAIDAAAARAVKT